MNILWINPSFLDYRVPLYQELFSKTDGHFSIVFSKERIPERVYKKISDALGENAIGLLKEKSFYLGKNNDFANHGLNIPWPSGLRKILKETPADIIIAEGFFQWTPWAIYEAKRRRVPLLISYERTMHTERHCSRWRTLYRKIIDKTISGYLINGTETATYLKYIGLQKPFVDKVMCADSMKLAERCNLITEIEKDRLAQQLKINRTSGMIFLCVARIVERKGIEFLLNAWNLHLQKHPHDHLLIVGDGPLLTKLQELSNDMSSVHWLGNIDYDSIALYYAIADVFILPTLEDNWSLVVPEAMACGLPIATSIYNGCHSNLVISGKNGCTFDPLSQISIVQALDYFHQNIAQILDMGECSKEIENEYSPEKAASRIIDFCLQMVHK